MVLCFDIGNTDIDVGVFENDKITRTFHIDYEKGKQYWDYVQPIRNSLSAQGIEPAQVEGSVLCSVVHSTTPGVYMAIREVLGKSPLLFTNDEIANITAKIIV